MGGGRRRKILYVPGMISAWLLPILLYIYCKDYEKENDFRIVKLAVWDSDLPKRHPESFPGTYPPKLNYHRIELTGDKNTDDIKLQYSQILIQELQSSNDPMAGIWFHFGDQSEYGSFVKVLDILNAEAVKRYMPHESDLWVMIFNPLPEARDTLINLLECRPVYLDSVPQLNTEKIRSSLLLILETSWPVILGFGVLLFFMILSFSNQARLSLKNQ